MTDITGIVEYANLFGSDNPFITWGTPAFAILSLVALWLIFQKAGEPGWAAIIPFYGTYVLFKITFGNGWKFLLLLIPIVGLIFYIICMSKLAKAFGKGGGFTLGLIFLGVIFYSILGFGQSTYLGVPA